MGNLLRISPTPSEMIAAAVQEHQAMRLREFAETMIETLQIFKRPLNGPLNDRLTATIKALEN